MDYGYSYSSNLSDSSAASGLLAGLGVGYIIFMLAIAVVAIIAMWKLFTKAGKPGWHSIIPFLNYYYMFEIAGMNGWMFLLLCIPIANIVVSIMLAINLAKAFGKSSGFAVGLVLLPFIFMLILAFGKDEYVGNNKTENIQI